MELINVWNRVDILEVTELMFKKLVVDERCIIILLYILQYNYSILLRHTLGR